MASEMTTVTEEKPSKVMQAAQELLDELRTADRETNHSNPYVLFWLRDDGGWNAGGEGTGAQVAQIGPRGSLS